MDLRRRGFLSGVVAAGATVVLASCTSTDSASTGSTSSLGSYSLSLDAKAWSYDSTNDVYYQLGKVYVSKPAAKSIENLAIYVPGAYFTGTKNGNGKFTVEVDSSGRVGDFTAATAPYVFPINTGGYRPQSPPTEYTYDDVSAYVKAGLIYVFAGMRGNGGNTDTYTGNAPWGVTDLKAAVRFIRYNRAGLPGDTAKAFVFGGSGGGAQGSVAGATGDARGFAPYLNSLGAAMKDADGKTVSDALAGVMAWVPITSLGWANASYEWNMGQFSTSDTRKTGTWTKAYSNDLAAAWAGYINSLGLKNDGETLTLERSSSGVYLKGSYYDYVVAAIQTSLNDFLSITTFPYTQSAQAGGGGGTPTLTPGSGGGTSSGDAPTLTPGSGGGTSSAGTDGSGAMPSGAPGDAGGGSGNMPSGAPGGAGGGSGTMPSGAPGGGGTGSTSSQTFETVAAYIDHLNEDVTWVKYDAASKKATVLNLKGFVISQKAPSKSVGAFDGPARDATENGVYGIGGTNLHFSQVSATVMAAKQARYSSLTGWKSAYAAPTYTSDFKKKDTIGVTVLARQNLYDPIYFLAASQAGYKTTAVAPHWRIRTGIQQGDTANTTELNLLLALQNYGVTSIDFASIWGVGHTDAEASGNSDTNFIAWVREVAA